MSNGKRTIAATQFVFAIFPVFSAFEQWKNVFPGPARIAQLAPVIIVLGLTANIEQAIDRTLTTKRFPARPVDAAPVQAGIRLRFADLCSMSKRHGVPPFPFCCFFG